MSEKQVAPTELMVILKEQDVDPNHASELIAAFGAPFIEAGEILRNYETIKVTDESQTEDMAKAKEMRLTLKKIRTGVETRRKELKEASLKTGRAIDAVAKYVKTTIEPAEQYLELQEKFVDLAKQKRAADLKAERTEKLMQYTDNISIYNLDDMEDATFDILLADLKKNHEAKVAAEQAEAKRIEEERLAEIERQKERDAENEKLKREAEERQKAEDRKLERINRVTQVGLSWDANADAYVLGELSISRETILNATDASFDKAIADVKATVDKYVAEQKQREEEAQKARDEEIRIEREKREKLEQEQRDRDAAEAKAKADKEEAERKALLAPDKDKITGLIAKIDGFCDELPAVKSKQAQAILDMIETRMTELTRTIAEQVAKL